MPAAMRIAALTASLSLAGACGDRARLLFDPSGEPGAGPITFIDNPEVAEVRVPSGPGVQIAGRSIDPDGVDTVYFIVLGGSETFRPFTPLTRTDTVRFGIPVTTTRHAGDSLLVLVFATDAFGNRGDTAVRRIIVE